MKNLSKYDNCFLDVATPIIKHEEYQKMKSIPHHNGCVYDHCLDVAYFSYKVSLKLGLDVESTIRGALLHDFYLYKFKKGKDKNVLMEGYRHSRTHPQVASTNALKYFQLNDKEIDIIKNHMFPIGFPRSSEAWVTTFADKTLAIVEYTSRLLNYFQLKYYRIAFAASNEESE